MTKASVEIKQEEVNLFHTAHPLWLQWKIWNNFSKNKKKNPTDREAKEGEGGEWWNQQPTEQFFEADTKMIKSWNTASLAAFSCGEKQSPLVNHCELC